MLGEPVPINRRSSSEMRLRKHSTKLLTDNPVMSDEEMEGTTA